MGADGAERIAEKGWRPPLAEDVMRIRPPYMVPARSAGGYPMVAVPKPEAVGGVMLGIVDVSTGALPTYALINAALTGCPQRL